MYPDTTPRAPVSRMSRPPERRTAAVPMAAGPFPECAPLAVPYVAFQQNNSKRYNQQEALNNGTLFPGLNLPFHLKPEAADVVNGPLAELQALEFVLVELGQYLDTHQSDQEAFALYQQYAARWRKKAASSMRRSMAPCANGHRGQ